MTSLLVLLITLWGSSSAVEVRNLSGTCQSSIVFPVDIKENLEVFSALWSQGDKLIAVFKNDQLDVKNERYKGRLQISKPGPSIRLSNLEMKDSGTYTAKIFTDSDTIHLKFIVHVNERNISDRTSWTWICTTMVTSMSIFFIIGRT